MILLRALYIYCRSEHLILCKYRRAIFLFPGTLSQQGSWAWRKLDCNVVLAILRCTKQDEETVVATNSRVMEISGTWKSCCRGDRVVGGCATKVYGRRIHQLAAQQLWGGRRLQRGACGSEPFYLKKSLSNQS